MPLPSLSQYEDEGIRVEGEQPPIFALCRYLAARYRDAVLATAVERRVNVPPDLAELLVLEDWHHPDLLEGELPSQTASFRQLAQILGTGDCSLYSPTESPNAHWTHWPNGGTL